MFTSSRQSTSPRILFVVISTIVLAIIALAILQKHSSRLRTLAQHDAFVSTSAFSQLVANWLVSETDRQYGRVLSASEAMLLGNHVYIKVSYHGDSIVNASASGWEEPYFPSPAVANSMAQRTEVTLQSVQGRLVIDAIVPLPGVEGGAIMSEFAYTSSIWSNNCETRSWQSALAPSFHGWFS